MDVSLKLASSIVVKIISSYFVLSLSLFPAGSRVSRVFLLGGLTMEKQCFWICDLRAPSFGVCWNSVKKSDSWPYPQRLGVCLRYLHFNRNPRWFISTIKFETYCFRGQPAFAARASQPHPPWLLLCGLRRVVLISHCFTHKEYTSKSRFIPFLWGHPASPSDSCLSHSAAVWMKLLLSSSQKPHGDDEW